MLTRAKVRAGSVPMMTDLLMPPVHTQHEHPMTDSVPQAVGKASRKRKLDLYAEIENLPLCGAIEPSAPIVTTILAETDVRGPLDNLAYEAVTGQTSAETSVQLQKRVRIVEKVEKSAMIVFHEHSQYEGCKQSNKTASIPDTVKQQRAAVCSHTVSDIELQCEGVNKHIHVKGTPIISRSEKGNDDVHQSQQTAPNTSTTSVTMNYVNLMKHVTGVVDETMDIEPEDTVTWTATPAPSRRKSRSTPASSTKQVDSLSAAKRAGKISPSEILSPNSLFPDKMHKRKSHNLLSLDPMKYSQLYSPDGCSRPMSKRKARSNTMVVKPTDADSGVMSKTPTDHQIQACVKSEISIVDSVQMEIENDMDLCEPQVLVNSEVPNGEENKITSYVVTKYQDVIKDTEPVDSRIELPLKLESHTNCHDNRNESAPLVMNRFDGSELNSSDDESDLTDYDDITGIHDELAEKSNVSHNTSLSTFHMDLKQAIDEASDTTSDMSSETHESDPLTDEIESPESKQSTNKDDPCSKTTEELTLEQPHFENAAEYDADCDSFEYLALDLFNVNALENLPKCKKRSCDLFNDDCLTESSMPPKSKRLCTIASSDIEESNSPGHEANADQTHRVETHVGSGPDDALIPFDSLILSNIQSIQQVSKLFSGDSAATRPMDQSTPDPEHGTLSVSEVTDQPMCDTRPSICDPQTSICDPRPSICDSRPSICDPQTSICDPRPSICDPQTSICDPRPSICDPRPSICDPRPSICDSRPSICDPQTSICDPRPSICDPQTSICDPRPSICDPRPSICDPRPSICDPRTSICDPRPSICDPRPSICDPRTSICDPRPSICDPRPSVTGPTADTSSLQDQPITYPTPLQSWYQHSDNSVSDYPFHPPMPYETASRSDLISPYIPPVYNVDHTYLANVRPQWNGPVVPSDQYSVASGEPAYTTETKHEVTQPEYVCMYQPGLPTPAPVPYGGGTQAPMDVSLVPDSTTQLYGPSNTNEQYSYMSEVISYVSMLKDELPSSQCVYQPCVSDKFSASVSIDKPCSQLPTSTQGIPPVDIAAQASVHLVDVKTDLAPTFDVKTNQEASGITTAANAVGRVNVGDVQPAASGGSVIAEVESAVAARVRRWLHQYGSADREVGQSLGTLRDVKPYVISGWISAPYLRALMTKSDLINDMFDNTIDAAGDIHAWIIDNCRKNTPAILARDLVFRIFTLGELSDFNYRKLSKRKMGAIRRCLKRQFPLDYDINVWKGKCLPQIRASVRTLFKHRVKHVHTFWQLNS